MRKYMWLVVVVAISAVAWLSAGCCCPCKKCKAHAAAVVPLTLCGKCGEIKGSAKCCQMNAVKCEKCGLNKGSPGCCSAMTPGTDAKLCPKCGEICGSSKCCQPGAAKCEKCGLDKGSPGCKAKCCG